MWDSGIEQLSLSLILKQEQLTSLLMTAFDWRTLKEDMKKKQR